MADLHYMWAVTVLSSFCHCPLDCKEIQSVHPKGDQPWVFIGRTDAEAETSILWLPDCKELTRLKRPWCWQGLGAGGEGDDRGWDGWMASPTRWAWVWVNSVSWWWTGRPGVLQSMGLQRVGHDWTTELNWTSGAKSRTWLNDWTELNFGLEKRWIPCGWWDTQPYPMQVPPCPGASADNVLSNNVAECSQQLKQNWVISQS